MAQAIGCKRLPFIYFALKGWHTYTRYQHSVFTRKKAPEKKGFELLKSESPKIRKKNMPALDYSFIIRYGVKIDILACTLQRLLPGREPPCNALQVQPRVLLPPCLLATPLHLPCRSFGHLRELLGNTSRRPLPYPPLIAPFGKGPSHEDPPCQAQRRGRRAAPHSCTAPPQTSFPRDSATQQVAGGVASESDYIPRRIGGPLHFPEIRCISSAAL